jgi:hypothetical protein
MKLCCICSDDIDPRRSQLGYRLCLRCGETNAVTARQSWTVVQEYNKGAYQLVTSTAAPTTLRQTNPKENRA